MIHNDFLTLETKNARFFIQDRANLVTQGDPLILQGIIMYVRHTYASLLIEQGENIKYIQNQLGHSNPTVTLNVYTLLMKPTNQAAAKKLEQVILNN